MATISETLGVKIMQKGYKNRKGQSLVETALVLPIILLILTGIIDFGLLFNNYLMISNASREGARSASIGSTDEQIRIVVKSFASTLDTIRLKITISPVQAVRATGDAATVTVQYEYSLITPIIAAFFPDSLQLESSTTMRCE